ncbi:uncharacterized protein G2W53_010741 [Senna tora]|uniref:Uncharacterized protein n=1 Tax=Senna tora TaxID=362788 RepID=A0A834X073_9FABA|nr:uncharacterized protein G2W53_010741 [Senna tora]
MVVNSYPTLGGLGVYIEVLERVKVAVIEVLGARNYQKVYSVIGE